MQKLLPKKHLGSQLAAPSYYYGVWLKHLSVLAKNGLYGRFDSVAEVGPGDSLGLGLAALLTGADRYYGLDVVAHANTRQNVAALDELVELLARRAPRPTKGWPDFDDLLDEGLFPSKILSRDLLSRTLAPERLRLIREALEAPKGQAGPITIVYRVPWYDSAVIERESIDLIVSQAVLEHVHDIRITYRALYDWLKPGGVMSHQIDFRSHKLTREWNGHFAVPEPLWKVMMGNRPYFINREPWSAHEQALKECGFELISVLKHHRHDGIPRARLASRWQRLSDDDLTCEQVFVQARKAARRNRQSTSTE